MTLTMLMFAVYRFGSENFPFFSLSAALNRYRMDVCVIARTDEFDEDVQVEVMKRQNISAECAVRSITCHCAEGLRAHHLSAAELSRKPWQNEENTSISFAQF